MAPMMKPTDLQNANLTWQDDGAPYSPDYDDVYFSREGGLAETHYVFLQANQLVARWQALDAELIASDSHAVFTIGELGFGTGLNFLSCWRLWQQTACQRLRLHYISCEKHPLTRDALGKALQQWSELAQFSEQFLRFYPDHSAGYHRLPLPDITLDLYYGDALALLQQQSSCDDSKIATPKVIPNARTDAWFLDGFTPAHNPALWSDEILQLIADRSRCGTTLSSYSVTGRVVRSLQAAGFTVEKQKGFGPKRVMLFAQFAGSTERRPDQSPDRTTAASIDGMAHRVRPETAIVIGAGLAGSTVARALANRGVQVTVVDKNVGIAQGASGNRQAVVQMRLNRQADTHWQFHVHSYLYALRYYQALSNQSDNALNWHPCGVLTLDSAYTHTRKAASADDYGHYPPTMLQSVTAADSEALCGIPLQEDGLLQPGGGWLNPAACCQLCLDHPLITVRTNTHVATLTQSTDHRWQVIDDQGQLTGSSDVVIIANSHAAGELAQTELYPVTALRGQVSHVSLTAASQALRSVVCSERYLAPAHGGLHCVGASYVKHSTDDQLSEAEHRENLQKLGNITTQLGFDEHSPATGRVGFRGSSQDYIPLAGAVPDPDLPELRYGSTQHTSAPPVEARLTGLYMSIGHGSHGTVSCPLLAEHVASLACGEYSPLPQPLADCVDPMRFIRRMRKRLR